MTDITYRVVFSGNPLPGTDRDTAISQFAQLLKRTPEQVAGAFAGKPSVLKKGVSQADAEKFCRVLEKAGLAVRAEPEVAAVAAAPAKPAGGSALALQEEGSEDFAAAPPREEKPAAPPPKISASLALVEDEEHQEESVSSAPVTMTCPSCGHQQAKADVCVSCHVVIAKFLQRQAEKKKQDANKPLWPELAETDAAEAMPEPESAQPSFFGKLFAKFRRG